MTDRVGKQMKNMRLDKYLADMKVGTRSEVKSLIRKGRIAVNGETEKDPGRKIGEEDAVLFDGNLLTYETYEYLMLNKPAGVISATEDPRQETVIDLLGEGHRKDLFPVGRLDIDTVGLLLITNDGELSHRLLSPKRHVDKTYYARLDGIVTEEDVCAFQAGLEVDEELTAQPAELRILSISEPEHTSEAEVTIREGKFHQIKRMFSAVGKEVVYLKRIRMGSLILDPDLPEGEYRPLKEAELEVLLEETNMGR
ncbi:MAG: pseudouridine synthase [Lachnospiraceae bacterium]|nr:pseudouridine synthase [Lachnospiraceae bacterium]